MGDGWFREDLAYRLYGDVVTAPPLRDQLATSRDDSELVRLATGVALRLTGDEASAADLAVRTADAVRRRAGSGYAWPGNFRELEQAVRSVLVTGDYHPAGALETTRASDAGGPTDAWLLACADSADDLVTRYCRAAYAACGSYAEAARRVKLDRRTLRARLSAVHADPPSDGSMP